MAASVIRQFLSGIVDYAGLFPPAGLPMEQAVAEYASYLRNDSTGILGRFVLPVARFDEFEAQIDHWGSKPWQISALMGPELGPALERMNRFRETHGAASTGRAAITSVEAKPPSIEDVTPWAAALRCFGPVYLEVPVVDDPTLWINALRESHVFAKIRTGGVEPHMIPTVAQVARFIARCHERGVAFKATAGLHHLVRSQRALTYEPNSPQGVMHGFLNVFVAAVLRAAGATQPGDLEKILSEQDPSAFQFSDEGVAWRDRTATRADLMKYRETFAHSFGSCSFTEPIEDLEGAGLL